MKSQPLQIVDGCFRVGAEPITSIRAINELEVGLREEIYRTLLPPDILARYRIDPRTLRDPQGARLVEFTGVPETGSVEIQVAPPSGIEDPLLYLHMADTINNQLIVLLFVSNDPNSPRFDVDRDWSGDRTKFGTRYRNFDAEVAAMQAGLAPHQVRCGMGITHTLFPVIEVFSGRLGHELFWMEPLAYHNAITFERYGCAYSQGQARMERIHAEFAPGGVLYERLDDSTPFRQPSFHCSIRGRSWAIHDGILGEPFSEIRMYKRQGIQARVNTCPGTPW